MAVLRYKDPTSNEWKVLTMRIGDTLPIGSVVEFASDKVPDNWLLCNGQAVSRTTYSELFNIIGTTWGSGDGSTTFNIPSKLGLVTVGKNSSDTNFNTLGKTGGEKTHTLTIDEMPKMDVHMTKEAWYDRGGLESGGAINRRVVAGGAAGGATDYIIGTVNGGGQAHNNLQPYVVSNYIIKAKQSSGLVATVVDNLTSSNTTNALSANQGKVLNEKITNKANKKKIYNITIDTNWTELNTKIVELQGIEETDIVNVYPIWSENKETRKKEKEEYAKISMVKSTENNIELICDEGTPNINLNLRIEVVY